MSIQDPSDYKTGNAVPSKSAMDTNDNAKVFDAFSNAEIPSVQSRLGKPIKTLYQHGKDFTDTLDSLAMQYTIVNSGNWSVVAGQEITEQDRLKGYEYPDNSNELYAVRGSVMLPITRPSSPIGDNRFYLASAVNEARLKDVTDSVNNLHTKRKAIEWKAGLKVTDPLQLYVHEGVEYLPKASEVPFTTGITFNPANWVLSTLMTQMKHWRDTGNIEEFMPSNRDAGIALNASNNKLKIGRGKYTITTPFNAASRAFKAYGDGIGETYLVNKSGSTIVAANTSAGVFADHLCAKDFTIDANGTTGLRTIYSRYSDIQRIRVRGGDVGFDFKSVGSSYSYIENISTEDCRVGVKCGDGGAWTGAIKINYLKATQSVDYAVQCAAPSVLDISYLVAENYGKSCCVVSASEDKEVKLRLYEPYMSPETNNVGLDTIKMDGGSGNAILEVHNSQSWNGAGLGDRGNLGKIYAGLRLSGNCVARLFNCELDGNTKGERDAYRPEGWVNGADIYTESDKPRLLTENCRFLTRMRPPIPNSVTSENRSVKNFIENGNFYSLSSNIKVVSSLDVDYTAAKTIVKGVENGVGGNRLIISKTTANSFGFGLQVSATIPASMIGKTLIFATGGFSITDGFQERLLISGGEFIDDDKLTTHGDVFGSASEVFLLNRGRDVTYNLRTYRPFKATSPEVKFVIQGAEGGVNKATVIDIDYIGVFKIDDMHQQCYAWHY